MGHAVKDEGKGKKVAPDGGWGWMVVLGASICNFANRAMEPSFGLLFGDLLTELHVETTGAAIIMSTMEAVISFSGFLVGPLMKMYSFRKVAFLGSMLSFIGLLSTAPATSVTHIICTYSIIKGLGSGLAWSSALVAVNNYFSKYRSQAVGYSMAGTGLGLMLMPIAVQVLVEAYGFSGGVMILSGFCLNGVVGATLFQPVKWHMKPPLIDGEQLKCIALETSNKPQPMNEEIAVLLSNDRKSSDVEPFKAEVAQTKEINKNELHLEPKTTPSTNRYGKLTFWQRTVQFMDLDLLKDPIYLNIVLGICLFYVAEVNFKLVLPFFIRDLGYSKSEAAFCLSVMAIADIIARIILPPISDRINVRCRTLFVISAVLLGISRSILALMTNYIPIMIMLVFTGLFRGSTLINSSLAISEHCSLEKLPSAFGLHMVAKGFSIMALGPVIGYVRDATGSYPICIHSQTVLMFLCLLAWVAEYSTKKYKESKIKKKSTSEPIYA